MTTLHGTTERTTTAPASAPINLDRRLDWHASARGIAGIIIGALFLAVGWWMFASVPEYRRSADALPVVLGSMLMVVGFGLFILGFVQIAGLVLYEFYALWIWTKRTAANHDAADGVIVEEERTQFALTVDDQAALVAVALWCHWQYHKRGIKTPWSVAKLSDENGLWIGDKRNERLLGKVSQWQARQFGETFARMGLIAGRSERNAGDWIATSAEDVIMAVYDGKRLR